MRVLPDTHLLIWAAEQDDRLPQAVDAILNDPLNQVFFSPVSLWEIAIKARLNRPDFQIDPFAFARGLLDYGFMELAVRSEHALAVFRLPALHRDPFDRLLIAQATVEQVVLLTADELVARYPGPIQRF